MLPNRLSLATYRRHQDAVEVESGCPTRHAEKYTGYAYTLLKRDSPINVHLITRMSPICLFLAYQ